MICALKVIRQADLEALRDGSFLSQLIILQRSVESDWDLHR